MGPMYSYTNSAITGMAYRTLQEGDPVEFDIVQGPKEPQAAEVKKAPDSEFGSNRRRGRELPPFFFGWQEGWLVAGAAGIQITANR